MACVPRLLMQVWIRMLAIEKTLPWMPAGRPMRTISDVDSRSARSLAGSMRIGSSARSSFTKRNAALKR